MRSMLGSGLPAAIPVDNEAVSAFHVDYLVNRILAKKDTVVVMDGEPGEGKSTDSLGMAARTKNALSSILEAGTPFDLDRDVVYRESDLIHEIHVNTRQDPRVVVADEGILVGAQARAGTYDASSLLDQVLSVSRIKGVTLFVLAPSVWSLASFVRNRRAKLYYHVEWRGLTTQFQLKRQISWVPPRELPFAKFERPYDKRHWESLESDPIWSPYEARKLAQTDAMLAAGEMRAVRMEEKAGLSPPAWAVEAGYKSPTPRNVRPPGATDKEWAAIRQRLHRSKAVTPDDYDAAPPRTRARART